MTTKAPFTFIDVLRDDITNLQAERSALKLEVDALDERTGTPADETRMSTIATRAEEINALVTVKRARMTELLDLQAERAASPARYIPGGNTGPTFWRQNEAAWTDPTSIAAPQLIGSARAALDATITRSDVSVPTSGVERVDEVLRSGDGDEAARMARWALVTSNPEYERAFAKLLRDPTRGHLEWTTTEHAAYSAVATTARAMSLTVGDGGYMVPFTLDPAIMLTNDGSNNPIRRLATVKLTTTNTWNGITSAGATSEWKTEGSQAADGSPTVAQPSIPTFFGDTFVPYSFEVGDDAMLLTELLGVMTDSADNLMATAYTTGNGSTAPQGIVTGLAGTSSEINTTGSEAINAADPYALQNALPARFSANATWQSHIAIANLYRQLESANGSMLFPELRQTPASMLGKPWYENSNMDGVYNAAVTANNYVLIYGDVAKGYFIVDRIGTTVELIPNLFGANGRPTGQRGALLWFRTGGECVAPAALRMLDVPTTA